MATVTGVLADTQGYAGPTVAYTMTWTPLTAANNVGSAISLDGWADRSVQFSGTWDSATAILQGSNDGTTYFTLTDPQANAISKTADAIEQIEENVRYVRPSTSGGGGSQSLKCIVFCTGYRTR